MRIAVFDGKAELSLAQALDGLADHEAMCRQILQRGGWGDDEIGSLTGLHLVAHHTGRAEHEAHMIAGGGGKLRRHRRHRTLHRGRRIDDQLSSVCSGAHAHRQHHAQQPLCHVVFSTCVTFSPSPLPRGDGR